MEFFNKKEEVIDIKLTQYGKYLLSQGKFKPVFYSFSDESSVISMKSLRNARFSQHSASGFLSILASSPGGKVQKPKKV